MSEQTVNIPQLLIIILVGGLAVRYLFFSPSNTAPGPNRNAGSNNVRAREADVERVQQVFPQVSRRSIMWDLQRNGGNVAATTERILSGRGLENPPQSFQPPLPAASPTSSSPVPQSKPNQPDLITRYNLKAKLAEQEAEKQAAEASEAKKNQGSQAWSANKGERQALLQRRREEMILAARRKMEAKVAAEATQSG